MIGDRPFARKQGLLGDDEMKRLFAVTLLMIAMAACASADPYPLLPGESSGLRPRSERRFAASFSMSSRVLAIRSNLSLLNRSAR